VAADPVHVRQSSHGVLPGLLLALGCFQFHCRMYNHNNYRSF
jgi:hypothetical protein